ncbi:MAG TPA: MDR family oxidoreductase [Amaricoccus sp.]|uniref:MDR family oxidoreductase n=1 Tax=Amaricoccus sp. TaxID=1872485 RepID=UPI002CB269F2|nr:MDR family oxidoreductase [Amaricoccus sp.]HMQ94800.1 MDR family oxidoreductase [Amaricoccus sp.]HMR52412.1 MDR family oxidoreductase [Amaricoccus sp.]HMR59202.1 MDR family oxidoreductase [Amaricoccus sp.]HMT99333.1 MDR family oxidoreductase [Amaricoccus sp.]
MGFEALVVDKDGEGKTHAAVRRLEVDDLPAGEVTVAVRYSTVNYKDGLCIGPGAGLVRKYPHVPGIDFAGIVEQSSDPRYAPGDAVVLTGWRVGEAHWGGYAQKARVRADWLVPLPDGLTLRQAMAIGTAGFTAMLAVIALEEHGLAPGHGPVLVTGAAGGVGSVAVAVLARLGHEVAAVTGRPETEAYLRGLGASRIVPREEIAETIARPMESETWAGCIDAVGGTVLARVTKQLKYRCSVAAVGNAGGLDVPLSVIPFLLRGVNILGIDSVLQPFENRIRAWGRLTRDLDLDMLEGMVRSATLADLPGLGRDILKGRVQGRVVVDVAGA